MNKKAKVLKIIISIVFLCVFCSLNPAWADLGFFKDTFDLPEGGRWYMEDISGAKWTYVEEVLPEDPEPARYITSQVTNDPDRYLDILTNKSDYTDFIFTFDIRFSQPQGSSYNRVVYLRASGNPWSLYGYWFIISVSDKGMLTIRSNTRWGTTMVASPFQYTWELNKWYGFKIAIEGYNIKAKWWRRDAILEPEDWLINKTILGDPLLTHHDKGQIGFGNGSEGKTDIDNVVVAPATDSLPPPAAAGTDSSASNDRDETVITYQVGAKGKVEKVERPSNQPRLLHNQSIMRTDGKQ